MPVTIRPYQPGDECRIVDLLAATMTGEPIPLARFTRQVLLDPNFRAEGAPVAVDGDAVVGFALAMARHVPLENMPSDADRGYLTLLGVAPSHQRRGIGSQLLAAGEAYLRESGRKVVMVSSYAPGYFLPGVDVNLYPPALSFLAKHGYKEVYRPIAMECPLWTLAQPDWVREKRARLRDTGVTVESYHPALTLPLLEFTKKEFPGDWVRVVRSTADLIMQNLAPPQRLLVAHEKGTVVGFAHHDAERFGPIGVAASQRGRGLGQVLMYDTLRAQRDAGYRAAFFLWSDDKTAARLYTAAGFREVRRFALMKKEL